MYQTEQQKKRFYKTKAWQDVRQEAIKRDNNECQQCKAHKPNCVTIQENVHHIKEIETHPDLALNLDNLICLCIKCHNEVHNRFTVNHKDKIDNWHDERW
jgi:5-methylcytosine-specific restriction protein A